MWRHVFTSRVYFHLGVFVRRPTCVPLTGVTGTRLEFSQRLHRQRMTPGSVGSVFIQEVRLFLNVLRAPHFLCTRGHPQTHQLCVCLSVMDVLTLAIVAFLLAGWVSLLQCQRVVCLFSCSPADYWKVSLAPATMEDFFFFFLTLHSGVDNS